MEPHFLLTGAGFSYNWGGYLASEAFEFLLSVTQGDDDLRSLLWHEHRRGMGFEDILSELQREFAAEYSPDREQNLRNMTTAVQQMFGSMVLSFARTQFEPTPREAEFGVTKFLTKFDAIFTLNQDTLLEQHYIPFVGMNDFDQSLEFPGYVGA